MDFPCKTNFLLVMIILFPRFLLNRLPMFSCWVICSSYQTSLNKQTFLYIQIIFSIDVSSCSCFFHSQILIKISQRSRIKCIPKTTSTTSATESSSTPSIMNQPINETKNKTWTTSFKSQHFHFSPVFPSSERVPSHNAANVKSK